MRGYTEYVQSCNVVVHVVEYEGVPSMYDVISCNVVVVEEYEGVPSMYDVRDQSIFMGIRVREMSGGRWQNLPWPR